MQGRKPAIKGKAIFIGPEEGYQAIKIFNTADFEFVKIEPRADLVAGALRNASALLDASMKVKITASMLEDAPLLKIISCATTGSDHLDHAALQKKGIALRTLREDVEMLQNLTPAAELSWALLMACARKLPAAIDHVRAGFWQREDFPGIMLNGKCLGIIGCGRIGGWVARYGRAFKMEVVGYDPYIELFPTEIEEVSLAELTRRADFISVHVHLTDETRHLVSQAVIEELKPGAILINTSRSLIVDEEALLKALESGHLAAAGLDVLNGEPDISGHPLVEYARHHDNLLITPHCGGFSPDALGLVCRRAAEKIVDYFGGIT